MAIEITAPVLPESVADALLLDWKKQTGERIRRDELLVEVETDKIVLEVAAPADGVLTEILQPAGATVVAGDILARMDAQTAAESAPETTPETAAPASTDMPAPASDDGDGDGGDNARHAPAGDAPRAVQDEPMSPAVRKLVAEHGLNPADITGSGRGGRVTKEDILAFISDQVAPDDSTKDDAKQDADADAPATPAASPDAATPQPAPQPAAPAPATPPAMPPAATRGREETREPMSRLRRTIAARLVQAQQTAALLTTFNEVNMQPVMDLRARYKEEFEKTHGTRLGFMSFFVKAGVAALQKFPAVNARIDGADIVYHNYHDVGIAVSSPRGLVVPVLRNCEQLSFADIETQIRDFGARARDGKIDLDDLTGGTFTVTNGGVFGSLLSTPIVNPPQSAILGMHKIEERPVAEDGRVVIRPMMYLALSYDHRIIDGQQAVRFLVAIKELLEDPAGMLLQ